MFRKKMSRKSSKRNFSRGASRIHKKNITPVVLRGGIRL